MNQMNKNTSEIFDKIFLDIFTGDEDKSKIPNVVSSVNNTQNTDLFNQLFGDVFYRDTKEKS